MEDDPLAAYRRDRERQPNAPREFDLEPDRQA